MTIIDTSVLIDSLSGPRRSANALGAAIKQGERLLIPCLVLYEWLRGPRLASEIALQEALFPSHQAIALWTPGSVLKAPSFTGLSSMRVGVRSTSGSAAAQWSGMRRSGL